MKNMVNQYIKSKLNILNPQTQIIVQPKVSFGDNITIGKNTKVVEIGYGSFLGNNIYIDIPELSIGEYTTIHHSTTMHGYKYIRIGHNVWIGQFCIIDGIGGTTIGNNVGVGAHSQLWSHMKFGDITAGCRWNITKNLMVKDDVWFVGHCIVSPITAEYKSMLMLGGVITSDMKENHIYGGVPAKDLTEDLGTQFKENCSIEHRLETFLNFLYDYEKRGNDISFVQIKEKLDDEYVQGKYTLFSLEERSYIPNRSEEEYRLMKYLLYEKAKFIPKKIAS
jgi:acetyltransferase-like isoleucine patch superfamily enzyme